MGVWLAGIFVSSTAGRMIIPRSDIFVPLLLIGITWPLIYFRIARYKFTLEFFPIDVLVVTSTFFLICTISCFVSTTPMLSIGLMLLTLVSVYEIVQFGLIMTIVTLENALRTYACLTSVTLTMFAVYDYVPGMRLGNGHMILNPNTVGLICMSVIVSAFAIRNSPGRLIVAIASITILVLTGSRASSVGAILGVIVILLLRRPEKGKIKRRVLMALVFLCFAVAMMFWPNKLIRPVESYFAVHSHDRGWNSGATGRIYLWRDTWQLFLSNPVIGVGFRAQEGEGSHNGYLSMFAETGILGTSCVVYIVIRGLIFMWSRTRIRGFEHGNPFSILVGLGAGYLLLGFFERYIINVGNPTSMLFLIAVFSYPRQESNPPVETRSGAGR
ncbi:MAG: O-antigen ligase family protein [Syntrophobacteraceae bacterium]